MNASYSSDKEPILIRGHHIPVIQQLLDPQILGSLCLSGFDEKGNFKEPMNCFTEVYFNDVLRKMDAYEIFGIFAKILTDGLDVTFPDMTPPIKPNVKIKDISDNKIRIKIVSDSLDSICQICRQQKPVCTANTAGKDRQAIVYYGLEPDKIYARAKLCAKSKKHEKMVRRQKLLVRNWEILIFCQNTKNNALFKPSHPLKYCESFNPMHNLILSLSFKAFEPIEAGEWFKMVKNPSQRLMSHEPRCSRLFNPSQMENDKKWQNQSAQHRN